MGDPYGSMASYGPLPNSEKVIRQISSVHAVILSSQLKEMLKNVNSQDMSLVHAVILISQLKEMLKNVNSQDLSLGTYKPIKLIYHPREAFYVIKKPQKITRVSPMRFKEPSDVIIATAFFQELTDVGSSEKWAKAPFCTWSPIPPPELRGESLEHLSTNGGFVSFDILPRHVEGKRLDKTVWSLLNFYVCMKDHVKVLHKGNQEDNDDVKKVKAKAGYKYV